MPAEADIDPYAVLGLDADDACAEADVRRAYRRRAVKYHPDKDPSAAAAHQFHLLNLALELLVDPERRRRYDAKLRARRQAADKLKHGRRQRHDLIRQLEQREQRADGSRRGGRSEAGPGNEGSYRAERATREELGKATTVRARSRSRSRSRSPQRAQRDDPYERRASILERMRTASRPRDPGS